MPFTLPQFRRRFSGESNFDDIFNVPNIESVPGGCIAINFNQRLGNLPRPVDNRSLDARQIHNSFEHFRGLLAQGSRVVAKDFDYDLTIDLRDALEHVVTNRLGKTGLNPW